MILKEQQADMLAVLSMTLRTNYCTLETLSAFEWQLEWQLEWHLSSQNLRR